MKALPVQRRICAIAACAAVLTFGSRIAGAQTADCLAIATPVESINMKVLVVAADATEAVFPAIKSTLDYLGVPYDVLVAKDQLLDTAVLCGTSAGGAGLGRYQAVMLTTGNLGWLNPATGNYESGFSLEEWNRLWQYEAKYRVRQATLYTYPGGWPETYGLTPPTSAVDTTATPLSTTLTSTAPTGSGNPSGRQVFPYLIPTKPVVIKNAYTYLAKQVAGAAVTPLLVDAAGDAIASIVNYTDGRKNLTITADGNQYLVHTLQLGYGIVNWLTKGLYIGQRKVYLSAQPDDGLIPDDMWDMARNSDATGRTYRITSSDYNKFITWQNNRNNNNPGYIQMEIPFNAVGATGALAPEELYPETTDDLTPAVRANNAPFTWISHTFTHANLDAPMNYSQTLSELRQNHNTAKSPTLNLGSYVKDGLITPDVSGLNNPEALRAMSDFGIRYIVSNTSKYDGHRNAEQRTLQGPPTPNAGIYNDLQSNILMVPRYPANLFYNVCTPDEWVSEYNFIYAGYWGRTLKYPEVLDKESEIWLRYLMNHDMRPVMFHQPNMCAYDGTKSLLGDLIDATLTKYSGMFNLPPQSRQLRQIGTLMKQRMAVDAALRAPVAPLTARIVPGATSSSVVLSNPTAGVVLVPITGVNWTGATSRETYGGQTTSKVTVNPGGAALTVPGAPAW